MRFALAVLAAFAVVIAQYFHGGAWEAVFSLPSCLVLLCALGLTAAWRVGTGGGAVSWPAVGLAFAFFVMVAWRVGVFPGDHPSFHMLLASLAIGIYLVVVFGAWDDRARLLLVLLLVAAALAQAVFFLGQMAGDWAHPWFSAQLREWFEGRYAGRARGAYLNANHLAWLLNFGALYCAAIAVWARIGMLWKWVLGALALALSACSLLTLSRGGALALLAGLAVFVTLTLLIAWLGGGRRRIAAVLAVAVPVALLLGGLWLWVDSRPEVVGRLDMVGQDAFREGTWPMAVRQIQLEPLTGTGPNSFRYHARMLRSYTPDFFDTIYVHNDWLQVTADYGFLGLVMVLAMLAAHLRSGWNSIQEVLARSGGAVVVVQDTRLALLTGSLAVMAAFAVHSVTDFNLQVTANAMLAACALGLLTCGPATVSVARWRSAAGRATSILLCAAAAGLIAWFCVPRAVANYFVLQGGEALARGGYEDAAIAAARAVRWAPQSARAHQLLGNALRDRAAELLDPAARGGLHSRAAAAYAIAALWDPLERTVYFDYARLLAMMGQRAEARNVALRGIRLDPMQGYAYVWTGDVFLMSGDLDSAIRYYQIARVLPGDWRISLSRLRAAQAERRLLED